MSAFQSLSGPLVVRPTICWYPRLQEAAWRTVFSKRSTSQRATIKASIQRERRIRPVKTEKTQMKKSNVKSEVPPLKVNVDQPSSSIRRIVLEQPVVPALFVLIGTILLQPMTYCFVPIVASTGRRIDTLVTGIYQPAIGILFAMLASTTIAALRQRQQDVRDLLDQELAEIRMLSFIIEDVDTLMDLLEYTRTIDAETFSHRANNVYFRQSPMLTSPLSAQRETIFAHAEETLWSCFSKVSKLELPLVVKDTIYDLVSLRTRRRASLDTGFPDVHFNILGVLGLSMPVSFLLVLAGETSWVSLPSTHVLFSILLGVLAWGGVLVADLRDPFCGKYQLNSAQMQRTIHTLEKLVGTQARRAKP